MEPTMNREISKLNGKAKHTLGTIQDVIKTQPNLKRGLEDIVESERDMFEGEISRVKSLAKYVRSNWKTVLPAIAALGVGAYFLKGKSKIKVK
jgi:hypothetical protein